MPNHPTGKTAQLLQVSVGVQTDSKIKGFALWLCSFLTTNPPEMRALSWQKGVICGPVIIRSWQGAPKADKFKGEDTDICDLEYLYGHKEHSYPSYKLECTTGGPGGKSYRQMPKEQTTLKNSLTPRHQLFFVWKLKAIV